MKSPVIAVDFDGTVVTHCYPGIGVEVPYCVEVLRSLVREGALLILWTMRSGGQLQEAAQWFEDRGIPLWGVNHNPTQSSWTQSPKLYSHILIDDTALGVPLMRMEGESRPCVDWLKVGALLRQQGYLREPLR